MNFITSFCPQCFNRIKLCGTARRQDTGGQTDDDGNQFCQQNKTDRRMNRQGRQKKMNQLGEAEAKQQTEKSTKSRERYRFAEK